MVDMTHTMTPFAPHQEEQAINLPTSSWAEERYQLSHIEQADEKPKGSPPRNLGFIWAVFAQALRDFDLISDTTKR